MPDVVVWILALVLIGAGLAGTVLPALPGPALVFVGVLVVAWDGGFTRIRLATIGLLALLTVAAHLVDLAGGAVGVHRAGASGRAVAGAGLGAAVGILFGVPGLVLGPLIGAVAAELTVRPDLRAASSVGLAAGIGFLVGTAAKVALVVAIVAIGGAAYFF